MIFRQSIKFLVEYLDVV